MTTLFMTKGLPASGKSTWAKEFMLNRPADTVVRVNKDCLRYMLHNDRHKGKTERQVIDARNALVGLHLAAGVSVIVDDTNFNPIHERKLKELADKHAAGFEILDFTSVPLEQCIRRDLKRVRTVGERVIKEMWQKYLAPAPVAPPVFDASLPTVTLVDIDGTVALNTGGRGYYDWPRVGEDTPNQPVIDIVQSLVQDGGYEDGRSIVFMSGRDGICEAETRAWLGKHLGYWTKDSPLHMRPVGDGRQDAIVKRELYDQHIAGRYNVRAVLDDRNQVVSMWRGLGLTCLQVADGDF